MVAVEAALRTSRTPLEAKEGTQAAASWGRQSLQDHNYRKSCSFGLPAVTVDNPAPVDPELVRLQRWHSGTHAMGMRCQTLVGYVGVVFARRMHL